MKKYYHLVKAFEKQIKTIENQGENQIKAIEEHRKQLAESNALIKKYDFDTEKHRPTLLKQKETFNKLIDDRHDEIIELSKKINYDDLMYHFKSKYFRKKVLMIWIMHSGF